MIVDCHQVKSCVHDGSDATIHTRISPIVEVEFDDVHSSSQEVVQVRVLNGDKYVNFWVRVMVNNQDRVQCEVATNVVSKSVRKVVTAGAWRDR